MLKAISEHCCEMMNDFLQDPRVQISYVPKFREYYIPLIYQGKTTAIQCLFYCPWCGKQLPKELRDEWFDILEKEYGLDDPMSLEQKKQIPVEFQTDEWWKKLGL